MRNGHLMSVVAAHAEANNSDPFAGRRMHMLLQRGIESPKDVREEAERITKARRDGLRRWSRSPAFAAQKVALCGRLGLAVA